MIFFRLSEKKENAASGMHRTPREELQLFQEAV